MGEAPVGRWWAQHGHWPGTDPVEPMPDTHKHYAEHGSSLERTFIALGYVPVPAPHTDPYDIFPTGDYTDDLAPVKVIRPSGKRRRS